LGRKEKGGEENRPRNLRALPLLSFYKKKGSERRGGRERTSSLPFFYLFPLSLTRRCLELLQRKEKALRGIARFHPRTFKERGGKRRKLRGRKKKEKPDGSDLPSFLLPVAGNWRKRKNRTAL